MRLFLDSLPEQDREFRKEAGYTHRLSETPDDWSQEIGSELYKQLPFLSDYEVNVDLEKQDPGRGYAFGYADVSNRTERPEAEHEESGIPHIRIPIVAEERQVRPFSVFMDGERVLPMTEERLRETLFNPATFDLSNSVPRDPSLVEPLMPPQRSGIGLGGEYKMASAEEKFAMAMESSSPASSLSGPVLPWSVEKYKNHPDLLRKAIGLEKETLELDKKSGGLNQIKPYKPNPKQEAINKKRDSINFRRRELELELAEKAVKSKTAFQHISKPQWDAIKNSAKVVGLVQKHGTDKHPEVVNAIYELAAKEYGYHPRVYPPTAEQQMKQIQKSVDKAAKDAPQVGGQTAAAKPGAPAPKTKKAASILMKIASTIRESDRDAFVEKVASDPTLRAGFLRSGIASLLVEVMDTKLASASDRLSALADNIEPSVVTFQKLPGGDFMVKSANVNAFAGGQQAAGQVVPFEEVAEAIGEEAAQSMQPGQTATAVSDPVEIDGDDANTSAAIDSDGTYKVQDADGKELKGVVIPELFSWDSELTPQKTGLFVGEKNYAIQNDLVGEKVDDDIKLPIDIPKGEGIFRSPSSDRASSPITVKFGETRPDGTSRYVGTDSFGNELKISVLPNLKEPKALSETEFAVPQSWHFLRFNKKVNLAGEVGTAKKVRKEKTSAVLFYNGSFNAQGDGCGLNKIATDLTQDLDAVGAEFLLGLLGVDGVSAKQKVAEARKKGHVKLAGLKTITPLRERYAESVKTASSLLSKLPNLRRDLLKEAASIEDQGTVDKVLALNFINPENLSTFVEYLPELEECSEKMAEMVLAGYLGMKEIPVGAVERSMKNMEEVIQGLKAVQSSQV